jgi:pantoate--beta-alanine ligase
MVVTHTIAECRAERARLGKLALVPTMGALHAGHLELIKIARERAPRVAVSIFVNPTQFGPGEDFLRYPRPLEQDLEMCGRAGVDLVFHPPVREMYPDGLGKIVFDLPQLSGVLEGKSRPGHFQGVCLVVAKLFNIVQPDAACFGQKDYQQLRILTRMVQEMNWPIEIVPCPTLRDADGLAISSRNRYLSADERRRALAISRGLAAAESEFKRGERRGERLERIVRDALGGGELAIDYVAAVDALTLAEVASITAPAVLAVAARAGATRLIDNVILMP